MTGVFRNPEPSHLDLDAALNKPDELKKWKAERAKYPPKQAAKK